MNNNTNKDFDELEPRVTPQPTILQCMTSPSVPEVSLIFGKHPGTTQFLEKTRIAPEEKYETYAHWKKDGLSSSIKPILDSRRVDPALVNCPSNCENLALKSTVSNDPTKFNGTGNTNYSENQLENEMPIQQKQKKNIEIHNYCSAAVAKNHSADNMRLHNYKYPSREEICAISVPKNKSAEAPVQNGSYEAIKSILKNPLLDRTDLMHSKSEQNVNPELLVQRKSLSRSGQCQSPRRIEDSEHSRPSSIPRCHHQNEVNHDHNTVRELLLLVQNQNEQIKSLQTQVERLLQTHEQNVGYHENHSSVTKKLCEKLQTPSHVHEINKLTKNNVISGQNPCQPRGLKIVSPHPSDDHPDVCLRYQGDQLRNTILEKKVSIGVMTSFEFSVQNNPFVSDSDSQINAVLRECGKNMNESGENWRANMHGSRNIAPGTLENINEDSESHPSSIWKQSNNNTQVSSSDKTCSNVTAVVNENRVHSKDAIRRSSIPETAEPKSNAESSSPAFFNKSTCPPVAAPRNFSSTNDNKHKRLPQLLKRQVKNVDSEGTSTLTNGREQESFDLYRADDRNNCKQVIEVESTEHPYLERIDRRSPRDSEMSDLNKKSIPTDNTDENSITLSSSDLRVTDRYPPSPDPSIHVEMREYSSDDDNEKSKLAPPVGWTFYKNVVGQVNRILHTIPDNQDLDANEKITPLAYQKELDGREEILDSVKLATLERLKMLGISYAEHSEFNGEHIQKKVTFDSSYYPRVDYQPTMPQSTTSAIAETNTSMHMKALALKYLSDEQLADLAVQRQGNHSAVKHKVLNSMHGTNMSLATMNYLQRYCLVSGMNTPHTEAKGHLSTIRQKKLKHVVMTKELLTQSMARHHAFNNSANNGTPDNILDITTLKQQPKLL